MLGDIARALGQLSDRRFLSVLLLTAALTAAILFALIWAGISAVLWLLPDTLSVPLFGSFDLSGGWVSVAAGVPFLLLSAVLVSPIAFGVIGLFLERIVAAVEDRHYPGLPAVRPQPLAEILGEALRFLGIVVVVNLLALVVYVVSTVLAPLVFWAVNGFLIGREYYQLVAARRIGNAAARELRRSNGAQVWLTGSLLAIPLSLPIVNLFVPVIGVAAYTHQFHRHQTRAK